VASVYKGNTPPDAWDEIAQVDGWRVYAQSSGGGWFNVKVVASRPRARKANFWLGWNLSERRMADNHGHRVMAEHYPDLMRSILGLLDSIT
jgi:hypothetical protein